MGAWDENQKLFQTKNMMLQYAEKVHHQGNKNCPYKNCQKTFQIATGLKDHVIKIHDKKTLKFKCTDCHLHINIFWRDILSHILAYVITNVKCVVKSLSTCII